MLPRATLPASLLASLFCFVLPFAARVHAAPAEAAPLEPRAGPGAASPWVEGEHYSLVTPVQRTSVPPGSVEVLEVFSYGCIACNNFQPTLAKLEAALPANARLVFLHAAFNAAENWPMLQRAYFTAQALGVAAQAHQGIYDAVWRSGELAVVDPRSGALRTPQATILDAARVYARLTGVSVAEFMKTAESFAVNARLDAANRQILDMRVPGTPCFVIDGRYRIEMRSIRSLDELSALVRFLVEKAAAVPQPGAGPKQAAAAH